MWLDAVHRDTVYAWRQLEKSPISSGAAILCLAIAIGACASTFRIVDALLLRPLPIEDPGRFSVIAFERIREGRVVSWDSCSYPQFVEWRAAVKGTADLIAISFAERLDLTYGGDAEMEKAHVQHVSGGMFPSFGLRPAIGRLVDERDDVTPGAHPYAVLSYDYWSRRFGNAPEVVGRTVRIDDRVFEIVGVAGEGFSGTEPGAVVDVFLPMMMAHGGSLRSSNAFWLRTFVQPRNGVPASALRDRLEASYRRFEEQRLKGVNLPKGFDPHDHAFLLKPAESGVSNLQRDYGVPLGVLSGLVGLVLVIAAVNLANLLLVRAANRSREMAVRTAIGASRRRLMQLVVIESVLMAAMATTFGLLLALWAAPAIVRMIGPSDDPVRLVLSIDWRLAGFSVAVALVVTIVFGLVPALRASHTGPVLALKGGHETRARRRSMPVLVGAQVTFCTTVLFVGGLLVLSYHRLANEPTGYVAERVLTIETVSNPPQPPQEWSQLADRLRSTPGAERVALADWPLLSGTMSNNFISVGGAPPMDVLAYFLGVSPGWFDVMRIPLVEGREFHPGDVNPGSAIVNETFARRFLDGEPPTGRSFETVPPRGSRNRFHIVGVVKDARYRGLREPPLPVVYVPFQTINADGTLQARANGTIVVRTSRSAAALSANALRQIVPSAHSSFRVSHVRTQIEIDRSHTTRERLLALLAAFFAATALLLAGMGLFGVLHHVVALRRREIGIRIALGARAADVIRRLTGDVLVMVTAGAAAGLALGMVAEPYLDPLLYQVSGSDPTLVAGPLMLVGLLSLVAALPPVIRATRIDPARTLRLD